MNNKFAYKGAWLFLLIVTGIAFAVIAIPVWLIQPFAPQTENALRISYFLKTYSPFLTVAALIFALAAAFFIWKNSRRWFGKAFLIAPLAVVLLCVWFARQNHFQWMFNPLENTAFASAGETDFVADDDMVLAVTIGGEAVAYPVRLLAYHHVAADVVGGTPITATY